MLWVTDASLILQLYNWVWIYWIKILTSMALPPSRDDSILKHHSLNRPFFSILSLLFIQLWNLSEKIQQIFNTYLRNLFPSINFTSLCTVLSAYSFYIQISGEFESGTLIIRSHSQKFPYSTNWVIQIYSKQTQNAFDLKGMNELCGFCSLEERYLITL